MDRRVTGMALLGAGGVLVLGGIAGTVLDRPEATGEAVADPVTSDRATSEAPSEEPTSAPSQAPISEQPASQEPVTPAAEDPATFYAAFGDAIRSGDEAFLLGRLHPQVLERYGADQCRAYVATVEEATFTVEVTDVGDPGPWAWETDGVTSTIPDALTVSVEIGQQGRTVAQDAHVVVVDGLVQWFTDCGDPV